MTDDVTKIAVKRGTDCIGVSISFVLHDGNGQVLLHKRGMKCRDEQGKWDCGGGALEFGETFENCLVREVKEEVCADIIQSHYLGTLNVLRDREGTPTHWISICYAVHVNPAHVKNGEPEKIDEIGWFAPNNLPSPPHTTLHYWVDKARELNFI